MVSNYIDGKNLGRRISVSSNALLYDLTGRSPGNRNRVIETVIGGGFDFALWVRSREKLDPEKAAILEYPAIIGVHREDDPRYMCVIGNGVQTISMAKNIIDPDVTWVDCPGILRAHLSQHGVEPDAPNYTPRIAGIIVKNTDPMVVGFEKAWLGIIYPDEDGSPRDDGLKPGKVEIKDIKPTIRKFQGIATYKADSPECDASHGEIMEFDVPGFEDRLYGTIAPAQALAEWRYGQLQEYYVVEEELGLVDTRVATAAIVLKKPAGISIGIKNRHQVRV